MRLRPLSFTKNLGGLRKVYEAIRSGYATAITVNEFRANCGLNRDLSLLVTEFFLYTQVRNGEEYVVGDTLVTQTLARTSYETTLARLYFFALNLNMPGERIKPEHRHPSALQNLVIKRVYAARGWSNARFDKDTGLEPLVRRVGEFESDGALRKWVNNYWYMKGQCSFMVRPGGTIETFADSWGVLGLRLFFHRHTSMHPTEDVSALVRAAYEAELHKLIGVPRSWLDARVEGAADMFLSGEVYAFEGIPESPAERTAAGQGKRLPEPPPGSAAERRRAIADKLIRRGDNRKFLQSLYGGTCQVSGVVLRIPGGGFTVDCAHIRSLGMPHNGPDDVSNMLSLSPTMHRLLDRGCLRIDPETLSITLLHGNDGIPHLPKLLVKPEHRLSKQHLDYRNTRLER